MPDAINTATPVDEDHFGGDLDKARVRFQALADKALSCMDAIDLNCLSFSVAANLDMYVLGMRHYTNRLREEMDEERKAYLSAPQPAAA